MDSFMGSVGSYWFSNRAKKEFDSLSSDVDSVGTSVSNFFTRLKGKATMKALPDLLAENDLPRGLFPKNIIDYDFDATTGALVVRLAFACEVGYRDQSVLRFAKQVTATLRPGALSAIDGIKTKLVFWAKVSAVAAEDASKVHFQTTIRKSRAFDVYSFLRDGWEVDSF